MAKDKKPPKLRSAFDYEPLPESEDAWLSLRTIEEEMFEMARIGVMRELKRHIGGVIDESGGVVKDKALHRCIAKLCEHTKLPLQQVEEDLGQDLGQLVYWQKDQSNLKSDEKVKILKKAMKLIDEDMDNSPAKGKKYPVRASTKYSNEL